MSVAWTLATAPAAHAWTWPADGEVLRAFSVGDNPYDGGQHRGVDLALGGSVVVRAPAAGEVTFAGTVPTHGRTVTIETSGGYKASLTHLGPLLVQRGAVVKEGDPVAEPGPSGTPEHDVPYVHLGIRTTDDAYIDPLSLLPPRDPATPPPASVAPPAPVPTPPEPAPEPPLVAQPAPTPPVSAPVPAAVGTAKPMRPTATREAAGGLPVPAPSRQSDDGVSGRPVVDATSASHGTHEEVALARPASAAPSGARTSSAVAHGPPHAVSGTSRRTTTPRPSVAHLPMPVRATSSRGRARGRRLFGRGGGTASDRPRPRACRIGSARRGRPVAPPRPAGAQKATPYD